MLLTGDMSAEGEVQWLEQVSKEEETQRESVLGKSEKTKTKKQAGLEGGIQILKIAHHGSGYSSTEPFLKEVSPKLAVISCGEGNRYGHPHAETLERLEEAEIPWVCTKDCGAILVEVNGKNISVHGYKEN